MTSFATTKATGNTIPPIPTTIPRGTTRYLVLMVATTMARREAATVPGTSGQVDQTAAAETAAEMAEMAETAAAETAETAETGRLRRLVPMLSNSVCGPSARTPLI
jgi:hypothetical protein